MRMSCLGLRVFGKGDGSEIVGDGNRLQTKLNTTNMLQWSLDRAEKTLRM